MSKTNYNAQAEVLVKIIDIAIECFKNYPPEEFEESHIKRCIDVLTNDKNKVINPYPKFKNFQSLMQLQNDTLIYFQESSGKTVDVFWKEISNNNIVIKRVNRLEKVLKRGKIKNRIEYDTVIDLYTPYIQTNMLSKTEIENIDKIISDFESNK